MAFDSVLAHVAPRSRVGCSCHATGAVQRANPLPAGRYWVDVFAPDSDAFNGWLSTNRLTVTVRQTEHYDSAPARDWYLFEVKAPTPWAGPGLPTIADASVTSSSDTVQKPDPVPGLADDIEAKLTAAADPLATFGRGMFYVLASALALEVAFHALRGGGR